MKKVYILGSFINKGIPGNDSTTLDNYMELGWELMTTGFWAKCNLTKDDYICTTKDRLFMYKHITTNLIDWENLSNYNFDEYHKVHESMCELFNKHSAMEWSDEIKQKIIKNNIEESAGENYVCVQIRRRDHCPQRNGPTNDWISLVNKLSKKYNKIFVVGQGNNISDFSENVELVNLEKYCSLIKSKGCVMSIGASSGCMALNYFYGRKNLPVHIFYTEDIIHYSQNHILFFAERTNLSSINPKLYLNFNDLQNTVI